MLVVINKFLIPRGYRGLTLFPFVIFRYEFDKENLVVLNHEKIHIRQQLELLILPFYVLYLGHFFINLIKYKDRNLAYRNIIFEKEAYANEKNLNYLKYRRLWGFLK
jgi:hypothetical protein